ncbi:MAG: hypothetical protein WDO15_10300 [Bacteroidota bacterium]
MKIFVPGLLIIVAIACTPAQTETTTADSTAAGFTADGTQVIEADSAERFFTSERNDTTSGSMVNGEYVLANQYSYISDPFDFSLDSATVAELLGPDVEITSQYSPGGKDDEGSWSEYTFYEVKAGVNKMSFYTYSGKHYADVYTSALRFRNGVIVGMTKADFLSAMSIDDQVARDADTFTINDDYGSMSFYFTSDTLKNVYVNYEEGT